MHLYKDMNQFGFEVNLTNQSMSIPCEERQYIGIMILDFETETIMRSIVIAFLLLLFPFAVFLNCLFVILVAKSKILQQTTFYLALQVVVVDLASVFFVFPLTITGGFIQQWSLEPVLCTLTLFIEAFIRSSRQFLMFAFVTDRFCLVFFPFRYRRHRNKLVISLCIGVYTISVVLASVLSVLDCVGFSRVTWHCDLSEGCTNPEACGIWTSISLVFLTVWGSFVPLVMYVILFIKARMVKNRVVPVNAFEEVTLYFNRERKANVTFLIMFLSLFGVVIVPFLLFSGEVLAYRTLNAQTTPGYTVALTLCVLIFNILPIVDPIAIMRHSDFRKALSSFKKELKSVRNSSTT